MATARRHACSSSNGEGPDPRVPLQGQRTGSHRGHRYGPREGRYRRERMVFAWRRYLPACVSRSGDAAGTIRILGRAPRVVARARDHRRGDRSRRDVLDVGCANGLLMETLTAWCAAKGIRIEPYGLDVVPELADLARRRLPRWADRIFIGNALTRSPPRRFDFVRTGLEYVPPRRRRDLVDRMMRDVVAVTGR